MFLTNNILPYDGEAYYLSGLIDRTGSDQFLEQLLQEIDWQPDTLIMFGKPVTTKRKTAWYAENNLRYTYSKSTKTGLPFTAGLLQLKNIAEKNCDCSFNSCLLNLYHNGSEGMSWHSDNEPEMLAGHPIASFSFGAERKFSFRHRQTKETLSLLLEHGSLLLMQGATQQNWLHQLPKSARVTAPRINLTFRRIISPAQQKRSL